MVHEFIAFQQMISNHRLEDCYQILNHTLTVCEVYQICKENFVLSAMVKLAALFIP